ncbi:hypothetical protein ACFZCU_32450 [Streptomyces canus]|uniref:hypothetical protein n=1 Tax=Streptomyces canus TaxID=58343 RepID=UPI0036EDD2CD
MGKLRGAINLTVGDGIPYKSRIAWEHIPDELTGKLALLVSEGMLEEDAEEFRITELGWVWYANTVHYLSPASDQKVLDEFTALKRRTKGLTDGDDRMLPLLPIDSAQ